MHYSIITALISITFAIPVMAQTWTQQQQMLNEKTNIDAELFHQREELESIKRENKRALDRQRQQMEQQKLQLQKYNSPLLKRSNTTSEKINSNPQQSEKSSKAQEALINREFVLREQMNSEMVFNGEYFSKSKFWTTLTKHMRADDINALIDATKVHMLLMEKAARNGSAEHQRRLAIAYLEGEEIKRNYKQAVKWFQAAAIQGDEEAEAYLDRMGKLGSR